MQILRTITALRSALAPLHSSVAKLGFVPTMGALHAGHLSLFDACRTDQCRCVASIFVNPTQFGPDEDFNRYPRDEAGDLEKCRAAGVELVFVPNADEMFYANASTRVSVGPLGEQLCGPFRPGHFDGVATVVAKLFNIVQPQRAYFGEKDAQQLAILRRMVRDLDFPIEIVGCPTLREPDGLALSSRNALLTIEERLLAVSLHEALDCARELIESGQDDPAVAFMAGGAVLQAAGITKVDYFSVVDPETLAPVDRITGPVLVAGAVHIGRTRLIDNVAVDPRRPAS